MLGFRTGRIIEGHQGEKVGKGGSHLVSQENVKRKGKKTVAHQTKKTLQNPLMHGEMPSLGANM